MFLDSFQWFVLYLYIRRGGCITCVVTGSRQYSADLEIPSCYIFKAIEVSEMEKARLLFGVYHLFHQS